MNERGRPTERFRSGFGSNIVIYDNMTFRRCNIGKVWMKPVEKAVLEMHEEQYRRWKNGSWVRRPTGEAPSELNARLRRNAAAAGEDLD